MARTTKTLSCVHGPGAIGFSACTAGCDALSPTRPRRGAGVVERGGLENRCPFTGTQGSNPCLSAITCFKLLKLLSNFKV